MPKYDFNKIEKKWQKAWLKEGVYNPSLKKAQRPFYNLMMFPYPSAEGLHVGNMYAFTGADIYGRFKRMQGYDVFQPIGLDGFGIHSENYALKIGEHPARQAKISEKRFYKQLESIGNGFAWEKHLETYDPEYYRWTQWIFIQMFKNGLAYRKRQPVNWCPKDKTVLADEQVVSGKCERCGSVVEQKELEQWFFKITKYADRMLKNLDKIDWSEKVKIAQRNWIGKSEGAMIKFPLTDITGEKDGKHSVEVFTTRPDTIFGATFVVISPELANSWVRVGWGAPKEVGLYIKEALKRRSSEVLGDTKKTGVFSGIYAINPANKEKIPVWISDYVLSSYGTGAIMAVPAHDERDAEFAKKFNIAISNAPLVSADEGIRRSGGEKKTQFRLRDWLVSRQRYWGPPIPMIYCEACGKAGKGERKEMPGWFTVSEKNLPVKLPLVKDFRPQGKGESPLAALKSFYETKCPGCGGKARRETDVSDTFLDSAWYYVGYLNLKNPFDKVGAKKWLPVNMYTGGAEHSVLHLLYSRFLAMAFHDQGLLDFEEPFTKFRAHGLIIKEGAKMSKSKGNVINPDEYIKRFGADSLRMYLMFLAPFEQGGDFRDAGILGITRFLERVWKLFSGSLKFGEEKNKELEKLLHRTIKKVTSDVEGLQYNTAISALMIYLNEIESDISRLDKNSLESFLKLLAPFAPHITEEVWHEVLGNKKSLHVSGWPEYDSKLIEEDEFDLVVQINGKRRDIIKAKVGISEDKARELALESERVREFLGGRPMRKVIYVKNRLINFVI